MCVRGGVGCNSSELQTKSQVSAVPRGGGGGMEAVVMLLMLLAFWPKYLSGMLFSP